MTIFKLFSILLITFLFFNNICINNAFGFEDTVPHTINYQWLVDNASGEPVDYPLSFRFSLWSDWDFQEGSILENGKINEEILGFTGYQEVQILKPDNDWFFHTAIWKNNKLPNLELNLHKFLQIEVKPVDLDDSFYEILDIDNDINNNTDRRVISSSAYAINADNVDNRSVWTNSWNIVILWEDWKFDSKFIPNKINSKDFILNNNNEENVVVKIWFNKILEKTISWVNNRFELTDSLFVFWDISNNWVVNGRNLKKDGEKLDTVETGATADQKASEVFFESEDFVANNVHDALVWLKNILKEQERLCLEKDLEKWSNWNNWKEWKKDEKNFYSEEKSFNMFKWWILDALHVKINDPKIISKNVQEALVWLKKMFESNNLKQEKRIEKLEQEIKILKNKFWEVLSCSIKIPNSSKPGEIFEMEIVWSENAHRAKNMTNWARIWDLPKIKKFVTPSESTEYIVRVRNKYNYEEWVDCTAYLNVDVDPEKNTPNPTCEIKVDDLSEWKNQWSVLISWETLNAITISLNWRTPFDISSESNWNKKVWVNKEKEIKAEVWNDKWESTICSFVL